MKRVINKTYYTDLVHLYEQLIIIAESLKCAIINLVIKREGGNNDRKSNQ